MTKENALLVVGAWGQGFRGYCITGSGSVSHADGADLMAVRTALAAQDARLLWVEGDASDSVPVSVPAPVTPTQSDRVLALAQKAPFDRADGWVRLCLMGFCAQNPAWDGVVVVVINGRSHWLHLSADEVVSFQTTLTPRLMVLLGGKASLASDALSDVQSRPERLAAALSQADLAGDGAQITAALIGAELAAMRPYWLGQQLAVIAPDDAPDYATALRKQGAQVTVAAPSDMLIAGMQALRSLNAF